MLKKLLILALSRSAVQRGTPGAALLIGPLLAAGAKKGGGRGLMKTALLGVAANYLFNRYTETRSNQR